MLTGDKVETAIAIGLSCGLLTTDMTQIVLRIEYVEEVLAHTGDSGLALDLKMKMTLCKVGAGGRSDSAPVFTTKCFRVGSPFVAIQEVLCFCSNVVDATVFLQHIFMNPSDESQPRTRSSE